VSYKKKERFILQELLVSSTGFGGVRVVAYICNTATDYPSGTPGFIPGVWMGLPEG
jgi:hypothetical protein